MAPPGLLLLGVRHAPETTFAQGEDADAHFVRKFCITTRSQTDQQECSCTCALYRTLSCGLASSLTGRRGVDCPHITVAKRIMNQQARAPKTTADIFWRDSYAACLPIRPFEDATYGKNTSRRRGASDLNVFVVEQQVYPTLASSLSPPSRLLPLSSLSPPPPPTEARGEREGGGEIGSDVVCAVLRRLRGVGIRRRGHVW